MRGIPTPAYEYAEQHSWSRDQIANTLGVMPNQVSKYVCGARRVSVSQKNAMIREFGDAAYEWVELCDATWRVKREVPKVKRERSTPKPDAVNPPDADWDGTTYTIEEWKELFGTPGRGVDEHGRIIGFSPYFATEPDYCD